MRIHVLSDLHLEFQTWDPPSASADAVVLAGDIAPGTAGIEWARTAFAGIPVIYVAGNHEFYGGSIGSTLERLRAAAAGSNVSFLDAGEIVLGGVRFLGATLWTDFDFYGEERRARSMAEAKHGINDFHLIRREGSELFRPEHARDIHRAQVAWFTERLAEPFDGPTVAVTHFLPHRLSIHSRYEDDPFNPAFASDLSRLVGPPVSLWIHGHTHESCRYAAQGTEVVCNPRGYLPMEPNRRFEPRLVVDVPVRRPGR